MVVKVFIGSDSRWWFKLGSKQRVSVGSSPRATYRLAEKGLATEQFIIETTREECRILHRATKGPSTRVNGVETSKAILQSGDIVSAGAAKWRVEIDVLAASQSMIKIPKALILRYQIIQLGDGIVQYSGPLEQETWKLLTRCLNQHSTFLIANHRAARLPSDVVFDPDKDLFREAPEAIRKQESLHVLGHSNGSQESASNTGLSDASFWSLFQQLSESDAVIALLAEGDENRIAEKLKMHIGWFARPSVLERFLEQGSQQLRSGLIGKFWGAFLVNNDDEWKLFANAEHLPSWEAARLPNPPS